MDDTYISSSIVNSVTIYKSCRWRHIDVKNSLPAYSYSVPNVPRHYFLEAVEKTRKSSNLIGCKIHRTKVGYIDIND